MGWSEGHAALQKLHPNHNQTLEEEASLIVSDFDDLFDEFVDGTNRKDKRVPAFTYARLDEIKDKFDKLHEIVKVQADEIADWEARYGY